MKLSGAYLYNLIKCKGNEIKNYRKQKKSIFYFLSLFMLLQVPQNNNCKRLKGVSEKIYNPNKVNLHFHLQSLLFICTS